jgi:hypothetical protein
MKEPFTITNPGNTKTLKILPALCNISTHINIALAPQFGVMYELKTFSQVLICELLILHAKAIKKHFAFPLF